MIVQFGDCRIELVQGDITQQEVDAIVNAANSALMGGSGVDGAIHRVGGPSIMAETDSLYPNGCPTGSAVPSTAGNLSAKYVLHAVGPVWHGGTKGESEMLASAYRTCLELAVQNGCKSIAFPALSTGVYGYPMDLAAEQSLSVAREFLIEKKKPSVVRFVLFGDGAYGAFARVLESLTA
ncbi:MAG: O-acetyl-ADP-ribose deacetylase [Planctomycetaceae bacterium]|nr:O-acetyl-ADP-ribose deacetylase [Planctomycetaceae bacterium]